MSDAGHAANGPDRTEPERPAEALPLARAGRWQPLRSGLLNLYRFDNEELHFEDGHLLLRGNNGTGKSRILALQLPFLLDGEVSSHRLEPDGDPAKRIEWNLLLGVHKERLGYTWLELGRRDEEGRERYLTLGCGLHAIAGRGLASRWFFITSARIGRDLYLQAPGGYPLSRRRLEGALEVAARLPEAGTLGRIFTTASEYRQAVNRELFRLDEGRYAALVNLLIQLRQPQLSRKLDESKLSAALSEALPPVSASIVADVAESFRSLQDDRDRLEQYREAGRGVDEFMRRYESYVRIAAQRRAARVRTRHSAYEAGQRRLRAAEAELEQATTELAEIRARLDQLALDEEAAAAAVETLAHSPQMQDAQALDHARTVATERQAETVRAEADHRRAREQLERLGTERSDAATALEEAAEALVDVHRDALDAARAPGLDQELGRCLDGILPEPLPATDVAGTTEVSGPRDWKGAQQRFGRAVAARREACRHLRKLEQELARARTDLAARKRFQGDLAAQVDEALERRAAIHDARQQALERLIEAYRRWFETLVEIEPDEPGPVSDALAEWCADPEGRSPASRSVADAVRLADERLATVRAGLEHRLVELAAELEQLRAENQRLAEGAHRPPPAPYTRAEGARDGREGAPLWAVVDFTDRLDAAERAGLEAALEASGLLDAWLMPDGRLLDPDLHDTVLVAGPARPVGLAEPRPGTLGTVLRPSDEPELPVDPDTVRQVLAGIELGSSSEAADAGEVRVGVDGSWQAGPLHGAWSKAEPQHVGRAAREAERRRRLAEVLTAIVGLEQQEAAVQRELEQVVQRRAAAHREAEAAPGDDELRTSMAELRAAEQEIARLRDRLGEVEQRVEEGRRQVEQASADRDQQACDLGIAAWIGNPGGLEEAISAAAEASAQVWPAQERHAERLHRAAQAEQLHRRAGDDERHRAHHLQQALERARAAATRRDTLEASVGAAVEQILARLAEARQHLDQVRRDREQAQERRADARERLGAARGAIAAEREVLSRELDERQEAIAALTRFAALRMLRIAVPEEPETDIEGWSVTRVVELARRVDAALANLKYDDAVWEREQRKIHHDINELETVLSRYEYEPTRSLEGDVFVVTAPFRGRTCTMAELRDALLEEVGTRQQYLDAREREIIENHLIGEVALHLHDLLRNAGALISEMNAQLRDRPMSTGMTLRFAWEPRSDGPAGVEEATRRLLGAAGTWSPAEREALGAFLQQQIQAVRATEPSGTWQDHLARALDYRAWHRFVVERKQDDGVWHRLTRRTHGTGSGGEKAVALTVPQFAAAAAHYRSADPAAPRLILLDEAFVGVDADMRAKCMGLLAAFDLDFVMTSEREWGCYPTLPGVAIYQLSAHPGIDAVAMTRWVWNGRERRHVPHHASDPAPPLASTRAEGS